ncbi:MAG: hypothetical protein HYZ53_26015 [Planctomycetes bacterium]|nr:hypothetical protein [Planctomycetota bacterium]
MNLSPYLSEFLVFPALKRETPEAATLELLRATAEVLRVSPPKVGYRELLHSRVLGCVVYASEELAVLIWRLPQGETSVELHPEGLAIVAGWRPTGWSGWSRCAALVRAILLVVARPDVQSGQILSVLTELRRLYADRRVVRSLASFAREEEALQYLREVEARRQRTAAARAD